MAPAFLAEVGGDMVEFEKQHPGAFADSIRIPQGADLGPMMTFDPVDSLVGELADDPEAGRQFFDPDEHRHRIEELLNRESATPQWARDGAEQARVIDALTAASEGQPTTSPGFDIAAKAMHHLGSSEADAVGLVNDTSREATSRLVQGQLHQVSSVFDGGGSPYEEHGRSGRYAQAHLENLLGNIARSPEAYAKLSAAEQIYTAREVHDWASRPDPDAGGPASGWARSWLTSTKAAPRLSTRSGSKVKRSTTAESIPRAGSG